MSKNYKPALTDLKKLNDFICARREFSFQSFGSPEVRGPVPVLTHLKEEVQELIEQPTDLMEWADCLLLLTDAADRAGLSIEDLIDAATLKLEINKKRTWEKGADGVFRHTNVE